MAAPDGSVWFPVGHRHAIATSRHWRNDVLTYILETSSPMMSNMPLTKAGTLWTSSKRWSTWHRAPWLNWSFRQRLGGASYTLMSSCKAPAFYHSNYKGFQIFMKFDYIFHDLDRFFDMDVENPDMMPHKFMIYNNFTVE